MGDEKSYTEESIISRLENIEKKLNIIEKTTSQMLGFINNFIEGNKEIYSNLQSQGGSGIQHSEEKQPTQNILLQLQEEPQNNSEPISDAHEEVALPIVLEEKAEELAEEKAEELAEEKIEEYAEELLEEPAKEYAEELLEEPMQEYTEELPEEGMEEPTEYTNLTHENMEKSNVEETEDKTVAGEQHQETSTE